MTAQKPEILDVTVKSIVDFGNETRQYDLVFDNGTTLNFAGGQFVAVLCPHEGKIVRRAYSIASPPEEPEHVELCIKLVEGGVVTNWFWGLNEGERIQVHGAFGKFVLPEPVDFDTLFVATGTGIAPFRSMIRHLLSAGHDRQLILLFGARYNDQIPYHQEFLDLAAKHPNFTYMPTVSKPTPDWTGETGYVQTKVSKLISDAQGKRVYICGLDAMIQSVQEACLEVGFDKELIEFEKYD